MNTAELLRQAGRSFADRPAVSLGGRVVHNYRDLARRVGTIAGHLRTTLGLEEGEHVALVMTNCPEYLEVLYGVWHAGLVAVPVNAKLHQREFAYILENAQARVCFVTPDLAETVAPLVGEIDSLDRVIVADGGKDYGALVEGDYVEPVYRTAQSPAWLFYTSGTTGRPKGAILTHRNLTIMTWCYLSDIDRVEWDHTIVHSAPMSHASGLYALPFVAKAANNVIPESGSFEPSEIASLIQAYPNVALFAAPTMLTRLIHNAAIRDADKSNLRTLYYGGASALLADLERAVAMFGTALYQLYGQGESPMTITGLDRRFHVDTDHPRYRERLQSAGIPRTGVEVAVFDEDDRPMPVGEPGEIVVRGEIVMAGYWRNPEATAETLRRGWLHTGDVGSLDEDGFLTIRDRAKDVIISGGSNIYSREVEDVLLQHDDVYEVAVVGRPSAEWGEEVVAFVVPHEGRTVDPAALDALCLKSIARFKRPKDYYVIDALPKNNYGKIVKAELRKRFEET